MWNLPSLGLSKNREYLTLCNLCMSILGEMVEDDTPFTNCSCDHMDHFAVAPLQGLDDSSTPVQAHGKRRDSILDQIDHDQSRKSLDKACVFAG